MTMTRAAALDYINTHPEGAGWRRDKSGKGYVCPLCGSGSGKEGTGLRLNKKDRSNHPHYVCFSCPSPDGKHRMSGDVAEFIAMEYGLMPGSAEALEKAYEVYGIEVENDAGYSGSRSNEPLSWDGDIEYDGAGETEPVKSETTAAPAAQSAEGEPQGNAEAEDKAAAQAAAREYIGECIQALSGGADYLKGRGISKKTAAAAGIGFDAQRQAIVIPSRSDEGLSYVLRYTNPAMRIRYQNAEGLKAGIFNLKALKSGEPVIVVEGGIDALSFLEIGYQAIGLNSTSNAELLIEMLERAKPESLPPQFVIAMDNDKAGEGAAETLSEGLKRLSKPFTVLDVAECYNGRKDANEALQADREGFKRAVYRATHKAEAEAVDAHKVKALLPAFRAYVMDEKANKSISTGFEWLDNAIGGGLFPRLYAVGAISSLGKTAFVLQIADNVAASGHDVLIFSLEMPMEDLIGRSISRLTYQIAKAKGNMRLAKTELGITALEKYKWYTDDEQEAIKTAYSQYEAYAQDTLSIYTGRHTAGEIRAKTEAYINATGHRPLVVIDYMQLVKPMEDMKRATVREQVDDVVDRLAAMRRELKIPIIAISSFNRNSYNTTADNSSFKESGGIEYTADCTMALELDIERKGNANSDKVSNSAKQDTIEAMRGDAHGVRAIKLTFLKNRGNRVGSRIHFNYNAPYNFFEENEELEAII